MKTIFYLAIIAMALITVCLGYATIVDQRNNQFIEECRQKEWRPANIYGELVCIDPASVRLIYPEGAKHETK